MACPAQWEGETVDGRDVYVRYRHGTLHVDLDGFIIFKRTVGSPLDGVMDYAELDAHVGGVLKLPLREVEGLVQ